MRTPSARPTSPLNCLRQPHRLAALAVMAGCAWLPGTALAMAEYAVQTGLSWYRVDNPFLFPENSANRLKTADSAWSTDLRVALFQPLPTERSSLQLTAAVSHLHYGSRFGSYTDAGGKGPYSLSRPKTQFIGAYTWEYGDLLRGHLRHRTDERLYNYFGGEITPSTVTPPRGISNVEPEFPRLRENSVEIAYRVTNRFEAPLALMQQTLRYRLPGRVAMYNMRSHAVQAALRYTAGTKSTLSAGMRRNKVRFANRTEADIGLFDSVYTDTELFADVGWRATENTIISSHLGTIARHFNTVPNRDSRLLAAELGIDWHFSTKTILYGRLWNRPQANGEADSRLYVITRGGEGRAVWQATPKTRLSVLAALESQRPQNFPDNAVSGSGNDRLLRLGLRYDYDITRRWAFRIDALREQTKSASGGAIDYRRSTVQLSLNYSFDNVSGPFSLDNLQGHNRARRQIDELQ